jgi:hypothetical protein
MPWYTVEPSVSLNQIEVCGIMGTDEEIRRNASIIVSTPTGYLWENPSVRIRTTLSDNTGSFTADLVPFGCTTLRKSYFPASVQECNASPGPFQNFLGKLYTGTRNDVTDGVGYEFIPATALDITALGRGVSGSMTGSHAVSLWRVSNQQKLASVTVTARSPADSLGYKYEVLCIPVALAQGESYRIITDETSGGDSWADFDEHTYDNHSSAVTITQCCWSTDRLAYPGSTGGSVNCVHGPATFYTTLSSTGAGDEVARAAQPFGLSVKSNTFSPHPVFCIPNAAPGRLLKLRIYSLRGRLIEDLTARIRQGTTITASCRYTPGSYVAVLEDGCRVLRLPVTVMR